MNSVIIYKKIHEYSFKITYKSLENGNYSLDMLNSEDFDKYSITKEDFVNEDANCDKSLKFLSKESIESFLFNNDPLVKFYKIKNIDEPDINKTQKQTEQKKQSINLDQVNVETNKDKQQTTEEISNDENSKKDFSKLISETKNLEIYIEDITNRKRKRFKVKLNPIFTSDIEKFYLKLTPEEIHYLKSGDFLNKWQNFSKPTGNEELAGFYKYKGIVWISGMVKGTDINVPIFKLPETYRPPKNLIFCVDCGRKKGSLEINKNGEVILVKGITSFVSLSGINFKSD